MKSAKRQFQLVVAAVLSGIFASAAATAGAQTLQDPSKHLLLDERVVDRAEGVRLRLGQVLKHSDNPLFEADRPWENSLNNLYPNVIYDQDDQLYKMWYKCVLADADAIAKLDPVHTVHDVGWLLLYATSQDGVLWKRPPVGEVSFDGSSHNNAVARDTPNVGVFKDTNPGCPPERQFKMVYDVGLGKMRVRFSPDGRQWGQPIEAQGLTARTGDTHNNAFWDARLGKYVLMTRFVLGERLAARAESEDFIHWQNPTLALRSNIDEQQDRQVYCMPAFAYGSAYLGFAMMYNVGADRSVDCELVWSPDTVTWHRVAPGEPFIPRGPAGSFDAKCIYAQANPPILHDGVLRIYYGGDDDPHIGWKRHCLPALATVEVDRFAGYEPENERGSIVTHPMRATGDRLTVSGDAAAGNLRVRVVDESGQVLLHSEPIRGNVTDQRVSWAKGGDFGELRDRVVRLTFELDNARLFAFSGLQQLPHPRIDPPAQRFVDSLRVTLSAPDGAGGVIRYTTDGLPPTIDAPAYNRPLEIDSALDLQARWFAPGSDRGGPIRRAHFEPYRSWSQRHPGQQPAPVLHRAEFDDGLQGFEAIESVEQRRGHEAGGGFLHVRRAEHQPYLLASADSAGGRFSGDLESRYGGDGVRLSFRYRANKAVGPTTVGIAVGAGEWSYHGLPTGKPEWSEASVVARYDWSDSEARAAGWQPAINAFGWQETMRHVSRVVIAPTVDASDLSFEVDYVEMSTWYAP